MIFVRCLVSAFIMGMLMLLIDALGDRIELDGGTKLVIVILSFYFISASIRIVRVGGVLTLCRVIVGVVLFWTLIFLPVILYNTWKN